MVQGFEFNKVVEKSRREMQAFMDNRPKGKMPDDIVKFGVKMKAVLSYIRDRDYASLELALGEAELLLDAVKDKSSLVFRRVKDDFWRFSPLDIWEDFDTGVDEDTINLVKKLESQYETLFPAN